MKTVLSAATRADRTATPAAATAHAPHSTVEGAYARQYAAPAAAGTDAAALVAAVGDEATAEQLVDALRSKLGVAVVDADDDEEGEERADDRGWHRLVGAIDDDGDARAVRANEPTRGSALTRRQARARRRDSWRRSLVRDGLHRLADAVLTRGHRARHPRSSRSRTRVNTLRRSCSGAADRVLTSRSAAACARRSCAARRGEKPPPRGARVATFAAERVSGRRLSAPGARVVDFAFPPREAAQLRRLVLELCAARFHRGRRARARAAGRRRFGPFHVGGFAAGCVRSASRLGARRRAPSCARSRRRERRGRLRRACRDACRARSRPSARRGGGRTVAPAAHRGRGARAEHHRRRDPRSSCSTCGRVPRAGR